MLTLHLLAWSRCGRCVLLVALSFTWVCAWTVCPAVGLAVYTVVDTVVAEWNARKSVLLTGECCGGFWWSIVCCCIRRISWFRAQDVCIHLAHDVLLLSSNTAWFLGRVVVHVRGNDVGNVEMSSVLMITMSSPNIVRIFGKLKRGQPNRVITVEIPASGCIQNCVADV